MSIQNTSRIFSDFYDSIFQRQYHRIKVHDDLISYRYLGKLRLDAILSQTIVLLDTQILDGCFFLDERNSPEILLAELWRGKTLGFPLEIRARNQSIGQSIVQFLKNPQTGLIKEFSFSGIHDPAQRDEVTRNFQKTAPDNIKEWRDIIRLFRDFGVSKDNVEEYEAAWSKWIELHENGKIPVREWEINRGFPINEYAGSQKDFLHGIEDEEVKKEGQWIFSNLDGKRSIIDLKFNQYKQIWDGGRIRELRILEAKYHRCYDQAAAWQHNCGLFESTISNLIELINVGDDRSLSELEKLDQNSNLDNFILIDDIDPYFLFKLGTMEAATFAEICWQYSYQIGNWWHHQQTASLEKVLDAFIRKIDAYDNPDHAQESDILVDTVKVFLDTTSDLVETIPFVKPAYTLLKGLNDIRIKYFSQSKGPEKRQSLRQRIIDVAMTRVIGGVKNEKNE